MIERASSRYVVSPPRKADPTSQNANCSAPMTTSSPATATSNRPTVRRPPAISVGPGARLIRNRRQTGFDERRCAGRTRHGSVASRHVKRGDRSSPIRREQAVPDDAPQGLKRITPADLLAFLVRPPVIRDGH